MKLQSIATDSRDTEISKRTVFAFWARRERSPVPWADCERLLVGLKFMVGLQLKSQLQPAGWFSVYSVHSQAQLFIDLPSEVCVCRVLRYFYSFPNVAFSLKFKVNLFWME